jgi:hypothetical protein
MNLNGLDPEGIIKSEKLSAILLNRASPLSLQVTCWMRLKKYAAMLLY